ncbi:MAG TPA: glycosyltransferase 87 family protein [Streptosporangiaceae bacterium]|nr:glycosyltransferase 87 family protein [Streptosporangiaceae bacterium]
MIAERPGAGRRGWGKAVAAVSAWPAYRQTAAWYLVFALFAALMTVLSGLPVERSWGAWAAAGYGVAALAAVVWRSRGRWAALLISLAGALVAPLVWQVTGGRHMSTVGEGALDVVARAGWLLAHHGTPYLSAARLDGPQSYNPYGPALAVFGLPGALGAPGWTGNPRLWLTLTGVVALWGSLRPSTASSRTAWALTAFATASPVLALPVVAGGTDAPILGLLCLALALTGRARPGWAGLVLGVACAMKSTAWLAVPVLLAFCAGSAGRAACRRFGLTCVGAAMAGTVLAAPAALSEPSSLVGNTVLFPLGLTHRKTTAASPLPGHLLAMTGPLGRWAVIGLLGAVILAMTVWLVARPPVTLTQTVYHLALFYTLVFILAPATRWGYFGYPLGLLGWLALRDALTPGTPALGADARGFSRAFVAGDEAALTKG